MDALRTLFRHHAWATLRLIDHCEGLPAERLKETVPGTAGPILATLVHLLAADQRYLRHMDDQAAVRRIHESEPATLVELRAAMQAQAARWDALVGRADELDVTLPRHQDPDIPHAQNLLFLQAIHHGNDHRTHVCTILGALDLEVPDLSGWAYWSV
ncbi:DinB family protein [Candidatus Nephthysia bennettiae]|uniref:DinB family protein n=1 Tax=Candidatus Nephthysia bennettiae TaxID=3127016 RepID=A0A934K2S1_9BACT|nr:DinB family protein [Candidatus Dormibacteraeota bacterium]MBJ7612516.1 DinB family protein [Candidatus Dormibacteraeota bacterium]